jgi:hypothetical protein
MFVAIRDERIAPPERGGPAAPEPRTLTLTRSREPGGPGSTRAERGPAA